MNPTQRHTYWVAEQHGILTRASPPNQIWGRASCEQPRMLAPQEMQDWCRATKRLNSILQKWLTSQNSYVWNSKKVISQLKNLVQQVQRLSWRQELWYQTQWDVARLDMDNREGSQSLDTSQGPDNFSCSCKDRIQSSVRLTVIWWHWVRAQHEWNFLALAK